MSRTSLHSLDLLLVGLLALLTRLLTVVLALHFGHLSLGQYANKGDGESYLRFARWINGDASQLTDYDRRVFPGYPTLIALVGRCGVSLPMAAVGIDVVSAAIVAVFGALTFSDSRIGWAMVVLLPHWMINSSLAMSEAPMLALSMIGVFFASRGRPVDGGIFFAFAGLVRPMACFAAIAMAVGLFWRGKPRSGFALLGVAAALVGVGILLMQHFTGDALHGMQVYANSPRAYGGDLLAWPGKSLIDSPVRLNASIGKIIYIYAHVAVVLLALGMLAMWTHRDWTNASAGRGKTEWRNIASLIWLGGNTALVLCIGSTWGFAHFPRFTIPAQPALAWAWRDYLPKSKWVWIVVAAGMVWFGVAGVLATP